MRATFLASEEEDAGLESSNVTFWDALIGHIRADGFPHPPRGVLDIGSHRGGLLERLARQWGCRRLFGVEPVASLRKRALLRLQAQADEVQMLSTDEWSRVPDGQIDLVVAMESFHLIQDLSGEFDRISRVLNADGRVYVVLGCHAENPVWSGWKAQLEQLGHAAFTHRPIDIMAAGAERGFLPSVRPLRDGGWVTHDPRDAQFGFTSVSEMLTHQFHHKLLFRFIRR